MEIKKCRFCGKDVQNLAAHIIRIHPAIVEQLDESPPLSPQTPLSPPNSAILPAQNMRIGDISTLIREKLDIMLNIKIIEMLSQSKDLNLTDIQKAINPPQKSTLEEIKEYHEMVYGGADIPFVQTGNQWVDIAQQAIPIIKEMLPKRKINNEGETNVREGNDYNPGLLKPIQQETSGSPAKPN
jgi:hypothetical protein